jgi:hypothetical protein
MKLHTINQRIDQLNKELTQANEYGNKKQADLLESIISRLLSWKNEMCVSWLDLKEEKPAYFIPSYETFDDFKNSMSDSDFRDMLKEMKPYFENI